MKRLLLLLFTSGLFLPLIARQDTTHQKKIYTTTKVSVPPEIDGWITDAAWDKVPWEGNFRMHEPYDDRAATQQTEFKVIIDEENIYIAIRAYDTAPDSIVSRLTRRDDIDGDMVAFQLDSYHDLQTAFTFFVSSAGSKMDAYATENGEDMDDTWNPVWWAKTQLDNRGWSAEVKIPFSQLRFDRGSGGVWGLQVAREIFRNSELSLWQPISREAPGWVHLFGELHGLKDIDPKKQAEIIPYAVAGGKWFEKQAANPFEARGNDKILNAGLDAKIGVTNNFTLDLTVNPDFGQVEADPSRVNLTAYETFFEEQRPFFIEGNNIFDYNLALYNRGNLFYSRRIGRRPHHDPELEEGAYARSPEFTSILGAAKITGKTRNGLSIGIMESVTAAEQAEIDMGGERSYQTVEPLTNYFASRVSKEFQKGNTILGGMLTSTKRFNEEDHLDYLHHTSITGGIDFKQYFRDRDYFISFKSYLSHVNGSEEALIRTQTSSVHYFQRPDADYLVLDSTRTSLSGYGGSLQLGKQSGRFQFMAYISATSPGLELNDMGFMTSSDEIVQIFWMGYRFNEPFAIFRNASLNLNQWNGWDFGGNYQGMGMNINGHAQFKNFWHAGFYMDSESEIHSNSALRGGPTMIMPGSFSSSLFLSTSSRKKLELELDLFNNLGYDGSGNRYGMEFGLNYKPISNIKLSLFPEFSRRQSELQYVDQQAFDQEHRYIFGAIDQKTLSLSFRMDLTLSPELTIQFWGQPFIASGDYSHFKHITDPRSDRFQDRFHIYDEGEISYDQQGNYYTVTESGSAFQYRFDNPDFNVREFLSNLVLRWEYRPGSFLYLVWSQSRSDSCLTGIFNLDDDFNGIWDIHPCDAVLLKISYRIGR